MGSNDTTNKGLAELEAIAAKCKAEVKAISSKSGKKKAYREAVQAQKAAIMQAIRGGDVRTTALLMGSCNRGRYASLYLADYDKYAKQAK